MAKDPAAIKACQIAKRKQGVIKAKSDFFRTARYGLTLQEHRVIYYAILKGQQDRAPFEPVTISIKELKEVCELKGEKYYSEIRKLSKALIGKTVEVMYKDTGGFHLLQAPWLSGITYNAKFATVTIELNKKLQPFFEGRPFSETEYYFLVRFTSQYAERLYEILKSLDHKVIVDFDVDDLAQRLSAPPSCRTNYKDLRRRVLEPAIKDINEFTDIDVAISEKRGQYNKVIKIYFSMTKKKIPRLYRRVSSGEFQAGAQPKSSETENPPDTQLRLLSDLAGADTVELVGQQDVFGGEVINDEITPTV